MTLQPLLFQTGKNVARTRRARLLTQKDAALRAGISYRYFQRIESGRVNLTLGTLQRLADLLGVHACDLLCEENWPRTAR